MEEEGGGRREEGGRRWGREEKSERKKNWKNMEKSRILLSFHAFDDFGVYFGPWGSILPRGEMQFFSHGFCISPRQISRRRYRPGIKIDFSQSAEPNLSIVHEKYSI